MTGSTTSSERLSLVDALFYSLMVGIGETYFPAFALNSGMSEVLAGYIATFPLMGGALLQLLTPTLVDLFKSYKKYVLFCASLQALMFVFLFLGDFTSPQSWPLLFLIITLYWAFAFSGGPVWNAWMTDLVPSSRAAHFFSLRLRLTQIGVLAGLLGGGWLLYLKISVGLFASIFGWLFLVAFAARLFSVWALSRQQKTSFHGFDKSLFKAVQNFFKSRGQRDFFGFLFFVYIAIFVSSPFVTPFMLKKMDFSYFEYTMALAALFIAKIFALPLAKRAIDKFGPKNIFFTGLIGLSPLPGLWPMCEGLVEACILQAASGAFWSLFEVSLSVIFFNQIKVNEKIRLLTVYNFFNSVAIILGTLVGGIWLHSYLESLQGYHEIFVWGAVFRVVLAISFYVWTRKSREFSVSHDESWDANTPFRERLRVT